MPEAHALSVIRPTATLPAGTNAPTHACRPAGAPTSQERKAVGEVGPPRRPVPGELDNTGCAIDLETGTDRALHFAPAQTSQRLLVHRRRTAGFRAGFGSLAARRSKLWTTAMRFAARSTWALDVRQVSLPQLVVVAATLWAAFLRFFDLGRLPPQAWFDEIWFALQAREFLQAPQWHVFYKTSFGGANAGLVYLTAVVQWLGIDTLYSARFVSAAAGTLSVPLAYACFRELFHPTRLHSDATRLERPRLVAMLGTVVLAYLLFYVIIARVGMEPALAPAVALLVVWQGRRALRTGSLFSWVSTGLVAGVAQYNGLHARFILPLLALLIFPALLRASTAQRRRQLRGVLWLTLAGLLASLPLILFFIREPEWFLARARIVTAPMVRDGQRSPLALVLHNARLIVLAFSLTGSYDPTTTIPGQPIFDPVQSVGFWVGVLWAGWNLRRSPIASELLGWLALMTLPSLLTEGAPNLQRMIGVAPPAAALVGVGWVQVYQRLRPWWTARRPAHLAVALGGGLLLTSLAWHAYLLLVRWPRTPNLPQAFTAAPVALARDLIDRAATEPVFVSRNPEARDVIAFEFLFPATPITRLDFRKCLPLPHQRTTRTSYLVLSGRDQETVGKLSVAYPEREVPVRELDLWQAQATLVEIPAGANAPPVAHTAAAHYGSGVSLYGFDWSGASLQPGETLFLTLYWHVTAQVGRDLTAFTHVGTGLAGQPLIAQRDGQPCVGFYPTSRWQPGEVVPDSFAITLPADARPGDYDLAVGWYHYPSLERLPLISAARALPDDRAIIATVRVAAP